MATDAIGLAMTTTTINPTKANLDAPTAVEINENQNEIKTRTLWIDALKKPEKNCPVSSTNDSKKRRPSKSRGPSFGRYLVDSALKELVSKNK